MPTGKHNKGEWGETYAALRMLSDKKLYSSNADGSLNKEEWLSLIEVIRHEASDRVVKYRYNPDLVNIDIYVDEILRVSVPISAFERIADSLSAEIKQGKKAFPVSQTIQQFLLEIELRKVSAVSLDKSDIFLTVQDPNAGITREHIGFSIKSEFGNNPTLFNTGRNSAVVYKLSGMNDRLADEINSIVDSKGHVAVGTRCDKLLAEGIKMEYIGTPFNFRENCMVFKENLDLIDNRLPLVIERMLWNHFFEHDSDVNLKSTTSRIIKENPCGITRPDVKYPYMLKSFLYASYCGLTAGKLWDGLSQVNGGFIKVNKDGDVILYYALESESFKSYLFSNCYLEFPSTSKEHGDYGYVYKENNEYYFRLNFQIRYK